MLWGDSDRPEQHDPLTWQAVLVGFLCVLAFVAGVVTFAGGTL